jgi:hypothetical protein
LVVDVGQLSGAGPHLAADWLQASHMGRRCGSLLVENGAASAGREVLLAFGMPAVLGVRSCGEGGCGSRPPRIRSGRGLGWVGCVVEPPRRKRNIRGIPGIGFRVTGGTSRTLLEVLRKLDASMSIARNTSLDALLYGQLWKYSPPPVHKAVIDLRFWPF